jgi:hypothetical protein
MTDVIHIKPHHFVDILTYDGAGKTTFAPHPFGHAQHTVAAQLHANHDILVEIELGADDICAPCTHNRDGECDDVIDTSYRPQASSLKREWNLLIDLRWCKRLDLNQGDQLSARAFAQRLLERVGDITGIYREMPVDSTAQRMSKLSRGISKFLGQTR